MQTLKQVQLRRFRRVKHSDLPPHLEHSPQHLPIKINTKKLPFDFFHKDSHPNKYSERMLTTPKKGQNGHLTEREKVQIQGGYLADAQVTSFFKMAEPSSPHLNPEMSSEQQIQINSQNAFESPKNGDKQKNSSTFLEGHSEDELSYTFSKKTYSLFKIGRTTLLNDKNKENSIGGGAHLDRKDSFQPQALSSRMEYKNTSSLKKKRKNSFQRQEPLLAKKQLRKFDTGNLKKRKLVEELFLPKIARSP